MRYSYLAVEKLLMNVTIVKLHDSSGKRYERMNNAHAASPYVFSVSFRAIYALYPQVENAQSLGLRPTRSNKGKYV